MTGILQFESKHGIVSVEVDDEIAAAAGEPGQPAYKGGAVVKGVAPRSLGEVVVRTQTRFDDAMSTLKAYAATLADLIEGLDLTPEDVTVEIGLKMSGSAGFVIAKAGAETEMKVSLSWKPRRDRQAAAAAEPASG